MKLWFRIEKNKETHHITSIHLFYNKTTTQPIHLYPARTFKVIIAHLINITKSELKRSIDKTRRGTDARTYPETFYWWNTNIAGQHSHLLNLHCQFSNIYQTYWKHEVSGRRISSEKWTLYQIFVKFLNLCLIERINEFDYALMVYTNKTFKQMKNTRNNKGQSHYNISNNAKKLCNISND